MKKSNMIDEDVEFQPEWDVNRRVEVYLEDNLYNQTYTHRSGQDIVRDPVHRFKIFVDVVMKDVRNQGEIHITDRDALEINRYVDMVPNAEYKNPLAYILGYLVLDDRQHAVDKTKLSRMTPKLDTLSIQINAADVLRYARLWLKIISRYRPY